MVMIDEETLRLFEANTAFRHGGDAERLRLEHKPEGVASVMDIPYVGESDPSHDVLHKLDVHRPADIPTKKPLPVIVDFHGGGLYHGDKRNTTCRDMLFAKHGFAVVNANYRLVPQVSFRDQLADAVRALDWIAKHCEEHGFDTTRVFITGDSAATLLDLYLCAVLHSPIVAAQLCVSPGTSGLCIRGIAGVSGMYRFEGGAHGTAMAYYGSGFFPTPKDRIAITPYLDMDRLVVDGNLPPILMASSAEDYLADNTLEFARILQYRHHDYEVRVLPRGLSHPLDHDFSVKETGLPDNTEALDVLNGIIRFFRRYC